MSASDEFAEATDRLVEAIGLGEDEIAAFAEAARGISDEPSRTAHALAVLTPYTTERWLPVTRQAWAAGFSVEQVVKAGRDCQDPTILAMAIQMAPASAAAVTSAEAALRGLLPRPSTWHRFLRRLAGAFRDGYRKGTPMSHYCDPPTMSDGYAIGDVRPCPECGEVLVLRKGLGVPLQVVDTPSESNSNDSEDDH